MNIFDIARIGFGALGIAVVVITLIGDRGAVLAGATVGKLAAPPKTLDPDAQP